MAKGCYIGLQRYSERSCLGRVKRVTAAPSKPWRERIRRSIFIATEDSRPYRIIVHSIEQGYEGLKMLKAFPQETRQRISFVVSKRESLGKYAVQK
jgi:hypothetical protein